MRHPQESPLDRFAAAPHRFDAFEALGKLHGLLARGRMYIRGVITNRHVAAPIAGVTQREDGDCEVDLAFLGLVGPLGPLPPPYTETALLARRRRAHSLTAFFDIFVQRFATLFVRAASKYRLVCPSNPSNRTVPGGGVEEALFAVVGLALPPLRGRLAFPDSELLPYAGLLGNQTRSAAGLEVLLRDLIGLPVSIVPFSGRWVEVSGGEQTRLGEFAPQFSRLGIDAIAGARIWDSQGQFRIVIGPLDYSDFLSVAPGGERMRRALAVARFYAGPQLSFDVQFILCKEAIPQSRLDGTTMLGWNAWLKQLPSDRDSGDAILSIET
jgi:type VI secretion system protein ImpH